MYVLSIVPTRGPAVDTYHNTAIEALQALAEYTEESGVFHYIRASCYYVQYADAKWIQQWELNID